MIYDETHKSIFMKERGLWRIGHRIARPSISKMILVGLLAKIGLASQPTIEEYDYNYNALLDEGEKNILDSYFRAQNTPTTLYILALNNGGTPGIPGETATLASLGGSFVELTSTGYARLTSSRNTTDWPTLALDSGDYQVESITETWTNSSGSPWTAIDCLGLCDVASGTGGLLLTAVAVSSSRTLANAESLNVSFDIKLQ